MADISDFYGKYRGDDPIGKLMEDFRATSSTGKNYKELADGVHHFKEIEKGREIMSELVQKYAEEYAKEYAKERVVDSKVEIIENLMKNMKLTLEQALNAAGVTGNEKEIIIKKLQS